MRSVAAPDPPSRLRRCEQDLHRSPSQRRAVVLAHVDDFDASRSTGARKEPDLRGERSRTTRVCRNGDPPHAEHAAASVVHQVGQAIAGRVRARPSPNLVARRYPLSRQVRLDYQ